MKQVIHRKLSRNNLRLSLIFLLTFSTSLFAQKGDAVVGKSLFNANCIACHKLDKKMTGPALRKVESRLADAEGLDREWLYNWIKNSSGVIKSGDAYANKIYSEFNGVAMSAFPTLTNADIDNILAYTATEPTVVTPPPGDPTAQAANTSSEGGISNKIILGALGVLFALLAGALFLVNKTLRRFADAKGVSLAETSSRTPIWKAFVQNQFLVFITAIGLLLASAYFVYGFLMQVGVNQGYEPIQPIHYSHRIHAGDNGIDCKYCHSSARVSKHSGIPSLNVCMNCHKSIYEVAPETQAEGLAEFGVDYNGEIKKLYNAVGWDDADQKYTGETSPVKWIQIHKLPDFAYFNHSQHVVVGGVECQTCHGPVEEMEIMYQHAPLTMGWCINCHRETNVKVKDNVYYTKIHEQLSKKYGVENLTAAQMGGLECGKCHY
ncbi:cytochrome c3 family protein [Olleya sp. HaHaR_3_96]|uniref:cytochrome c3 family protein n=1 Tax=Olleya sp. HaHaR_3_96 TaxID=2745560 RepID=UPI001C4EAC19|nr:cytochrome c3 family protein [Olleya sp. HaHaR_3_96]QXP60213.1 c-type cytochrome [Olleya sp. HaHaR_3_96]